MSVMTNPTQFHRPNLKLFPSKPKIPTQKFPFGLTNKPSLQIINDTSLSLGHSRHRPMFELVKASRHNNNGDQSLQTLEQQAFVDGSSDSPTSRLESILNRLSKWVVSAIFAGLILWKHDGEAVWAALGSVTNAILSVILKGIINQERPASARKSDPGMPSSHSQSIFFIVTFSVLAIVEAFGINDFTLAVAGVAAVLGSYLSWLRVSQRLHTVSQVVVGAVVGLVFAVLWYWSWNAFVLQAFESSLLVRIIVFLGAAGFCLGFVYYVYKNWLKDD